MMNQLFGTTPLFGGNAPFVEELYEKYLDNPASVPGEWREYFDRLALLPGPVARDVPHLPVVTAFAEQARKGGYRAVEQYKSKPPKYSDSDAKGTRNPQSLCAAQ